MERSIEPFVIRDTFSLSMRLPPADRSSGLSLDSAGPDPGLRRDYGRRRETRGRGLAWPDGPPIVATRSTDDVSKETNGPLGWIHGARRSQPPPTKHP